MLDAQYISVSSQALLKRASQHIPEKARLDAREALRRDKNSSSIFVQRNHTTVCRSPNALSGHSRQLHMPSVR